jgi:hypothetical protein
MRKATQLASNDKPQGLKPPFLLAFAARLKPRPYELRKNPHL